MCLTFLYSDICTGKIDSSFFKVSLAGPRMPQCKEGGGYIFEIGISSISSVTCIGKFLTEKNFFKDFRLVDFPFRCLFFYFSYCSLMFRNVLGSPFWNFPFWFVGLPSLSTLLPKQYGQGYIELPPCNPTRMSINLRSQTRENCFENLLSLNLVIRISRFS